MARRGMCSSPPKNGAFCLIVVGVSAFTRVRERSAESGSLKPMWPGLADAQQLQVNAAKALDGGFIAPAFLIQVRGQAVGQVRVPRVHVHMPEQVVVHVIAVGVRVRGEQPDIFIQVEGAAEREIELLLPVQAHQVLIDALHRAAGGQAQNQVRVGAQFAGHDSRHQGGGGFFIGLYDDFHGAQGKRRRPRTSQKREMANEWGQTNENQK